MGKTHNFYTTQSRWSRRPFEVLFVGHLQAFLITGSLRGAGLSPGFCLPVPGGEGGTARFAFRLESPCQSPVLGLAWEGGSRPGTPCRGHPCCSGHPHHPGPPSVQEHPLVISHDLEALADFVSMHFKWDIEWELEENLLFTKKALFLFASALHPVGTFLADVLVGERSTASASYQNNKAWFIFWHRVWAALGCILTPFTSPPPLSGGTTSEAHIDLSPQILTARAAVIPCLHLPGFCAVLQHLLNPASRNRTFQSYFATGKWSR